VYHIHSHICLLFSRGLLVASQLRWLFRERILILLLRPLYWVPMQCECNVWKHWILTNDSYVCAWQTHIKTPDINAVRLDTTIRWIVETLNQASDWRFASTWIPVECNQVSALLHIVLSLYDSSCTQTIHSCDELPACHNHSLELIAPHSSISLAFSILAESIKSSTTKIIGVTQDNSLRVQWVPINIKAWINIEKGSLMMLKVI
jgi:hypothetical protein